MKKVQIGKLNQLKTSESFTYGVLGKRRHLKSCQELLPCLRNTSPCQFYGSTKASWVEFRNAPTFFSITDPPQLECIFQYATSSKCSVLIIDDLRQLPLLFSFRSHVKLLRLTITPPPNIIPSFTTALYRLNTSHHLLLWYLRKRWDMAFSNPASQPFSFCMSARWSRPCPLMILVTYQLPWDLVLLILHHHTPWTDCPLSPPSSFIHSFIRAVALCHSFANCIGFCFLVTLFTSLPRWRLDSSYLLHSFGSNPSFPFPHLAVIVVPILPFKIMPQLSLTV